MAKKSVLKNGAPKKDADPSLSVPAAISEVAKGVVTARAIQPDPHASDAEKAAAEQKPPQRSRAELKADIAAKRAELTDVFDQIEHHLDVPTRAKGIRDDFRRDPMAAAKEHKRTTGLAVVVAVGVVTGAVFAVRAILK